MIKTINENDGNIPVERSQRFNSKEFCSTPITVDTFQKLNPFITCKDRELYIRHYNVVLNYFLTQMKNNDALFKSISNGHELGGSYADQLKVSKPNEFDTVIRLRLMKNTTELEV